MENELRDFRQKIVQYFSEISDDQLRKDMEKAGYEVYKNVDVHILSDAVSEEEFTFSVKSRTARTAFNKVDLRFHNVFTPDNHPYNFKIAA